MSELASRITVDEKLVRRPGIDVAHLPASLLDHRSPIWVGNLVLVLIETAMFCILVASYFYLRKNFHLWPPPLANTQPSILNPLPSLGISTFCLVLQILSIGPMLFSDTAALHHKEKATKIGLVASLLAIAAIAIARWFEFDALHFRWDANAYAAVVWTILGLHMMHILIALAETILMTVWIFAKGMDKKHARDVRVAAVYWYWVVGTWIPLYLIVYIGPRL